MGLARRASVRLIAIFVSLAWLASCAAGPGREPAPAPAAPTPGGTPSVSAQPGSLLNSRGAPMSLEAFAALAAEADYVLLGETHSSRCDHVAQAALIEAMAARSGAGNGAKAGDGPVVGLEMVDVTRQDILDQYAEGYLDAQVVEEHLEWRTTWGYGFDLYEPIFMAARKHGLPVVALNLPREIVEQVSAGGLEALSPEEAILLPEEIVLPPEAQAKVLGEVFEQHSMGEGVEEEDTNLRRDRFFLIQSLWDSKMAERAVEARRNYARPVAIVAGSGHVEFGWGIAHRLRVYDPGAKVLLVLPWRGKEPFQGADVFYYCPPTHHSSMGMVLQEEDGRVVVVDVDVDSRAGNAGLREGDVITMAGATPVVSLWDLHKAGVDAHKADKSLTLTVLRDGELHILDLGKLGQGQRRDEDQ